MQTTWMTYLIKRKKTEDEKILEPQDKSVTKGSNSSEEGEFSKERSDSTPSLDNHGDPELVILKNLRNCVSLFQKYMKKYVLLNTELFFHCTFYVYTCMYIFN